MDPGHTLESPKGVYKNLKWIGEGSYGEVYLADYTAKNTSNSKKVAFKKIAFDEIDKKKCKKEECKKEAELMKMISKLSTSQHIVKYFDSLMITETRSPNCGYLYIAMDYCSRGDLSSKIKENVESRRPFDPEIVYDYIYQIADGINELHAKNIVHRDLKPANILVAWENGKEVLKISDFGLVKEIDSLSGIQSHSKLCGTPLYMSPEQRDNIKCKFSVVDIWAIGIIFYELCIAPKKLEWKEMDDIRKKVQNNERVYLPSRYSAADTTWLNKMITNDPNKRTSALQVRDEARDRKQSNRKNILFYLLYQNGDEDEGRICLFNSYTCSVEKIEKFDNDYKPYEVTTTQNKVFGINSIEKSFEIYDLNTRQISKGPDPPEWRAYASVAYFKGKLYYLGGVNPKAKKDTNQVDVLIDGRWQTGPALPFPIISAQTITCDEILYAIDGKNSRKIYRLSDDEQEWIEIEELSDKRDSFNVASLDGKIYITGGENGQVFKSCLCFDPSAPVGNRISQIADMNYARYRHSLVAANEKLYAIGGFKNSYGTFCDSIEEYEPQTNEWREIGKINIK